MSGEKQIEKVWMLRERKDFDPKGFWLDLLKSHLEKKGRQTNEKCRYCLKPNVKTTCFEWNGDGAESCISMHLRIAFVKLLLLSSYERCSLKIAQEVCLLRLTFSLLFSSDFRRPRALRYRQARGWGGTYLGFQWEFVCVVSWRGCCVWHSEPDSRQYENSTHHTPCSLSAGWFGSVLVLCSFLLILPAGEKPNQTNQFWQRR